MHTPATRSWHCGDTRHRPGVHLDPLNPWLPWNAARGGQSTAARRAAGYRQPRQPLLSAQHHSRAAPFVVATTRRDDRCQEHTSGLSRDWPPCGRARGALCLTQAARGSPSSSADAEHWTQLWTDPVPQPQLAETQPHSPANGASPSPAPAAQLYSPQKQAEQAAASSAAVVLDANGTGLADVSATARLPKGTGVTVAPYTANETDTVVAPGRSGGIGTEGDTGTATKPHPVSPDVEAAQKQLSLNLEFADSLRTVQQLVQQHSEILNAKHVTVVLTWARRVCVGRNKGIRYGPGMGTGQARSRAQSYKRDAKEVVAWVQTFLPSTQRLLPGATLSDACGCLHALARLRLRPPLEWMEALLEACARQLPRATASQLGTCVWALGELGCDPGQEWLDKACDVSTGVFKLPPPSKGVLGHSIQPTQPTPPIGPPPPATATTHAATTTATAASRDAAADPAAVPALLPRPVRPAQPNSQTATVSAHSYSPTAVTGPDSAPGHDRQTSLTTRDSNGDHPHADTQEGLHGIYADTETQQGGAADSASRGIQQTSAGKAPIGPPVVYCTDSQISMFLWGLAKLDYKVSKRWYTTVLNEVSARWEYIGARSMSNIMWSLATLGAQPKPDWIQGCMAVSQRLLSQSNSYGLSMMLWALVVWRVRPSDQWLMAFFSASLDKLPLSPPEHIARYLWCCGRLRLRPPTLWLRRVLQQTQVQAFDFDGQSVALSLWAIARLDLKPPRDWLEVLLVASYEAGLADWGPQELGSVMWALGRLRHPLAPAWCDLYWDRVYRLAQRLSPQQLVNVLWGAARLDQPPPSPCLARLLQITHRPPPVWLVRFFRTTLPKLQRLRAGLTHTGPCLSSDDSVVGDERSADANSAENAAESTSAGGPSVSPYVTHESGPDTTSTADGDTGAGGAHHGDSHDSSDSDTGSMTDGNVSVGLLCELLVVALATMRVQPPKEWTAAYLELCQSAMPSMRQGNISAVGLSVAQLGWQPSPEWVAAWVQAADKHIRDVHAQQGPSLSPGEADIETGPNKVNRVSLRKLLVASRHLSGAEDAYRRWRALPCFAPLLEEDPSL